jgi:hypothetical protein
MTGAMPINNDKKTDRRIIFFISAELRTLSDYMKGGYEYAPGKKWLGKPESLPAKKMGRQKSHPILTIYGLF